MPYRRYHFSVSIKNAKERLIGNDCLPSLTQFARFFFPQIEQLFFVRDETAETSL